MPLLTLLMLIVLCLRPGNAAAQGDTGLSDREPRFFALVSPKREPQPISATRTPVLARRIAVDFDDVPIDEALGTIAKQAGFELAYSTAMVSPGRRVRLKAQEITVAGALSEVLRDLGVDVLFSGHRKAVLFRRSAGAERGTVMGRVTDAQTGAALADVEVWLDKTSWRSTTDSSGRYSLVDVDTGGYTLVARRLGYQKHSGPVVVREGQTDTVDLALAPVAARLNELVTTATGQRRRLQLGNDIVRISADSIVRAEPIANVTQLLEGRVPGLTVQRTSGAPGDPSRLRLRGAGSPRLSNDPIVVVDGMRVYAQQSAARSANLAGLSKANGGQDTLGGVSPGSAPFATPSPLDQIDPNMIETIEVLKGPSAATLYGEDAANGVIVITTKRGKAGPPRWSVSADHGRSRVEGQFPDLTARWGHPLSTNTPQGFCPISNKGRFNATDATEYGCTQDSVTTFQLLNDPKLTALSHGRRNATTLHVSGGSSALTYAFTGSFQEEQGLTKLPDYEAARYEARVGSAVPDWMHRPQHLQQWGVTSNITAKLGRNADLTFLTSLQRTIQQRSSLEQQLGTLMTTYLDQASGIYYAPWLSGVRYHVYPFDGQDVLTNDLLTGYFTRATSRTTAFRNGANLVWRTSSRLTLSADAGLDVQQRADEIFLPFGAATGADSVGRLNDGSGATLTGTLRLRGNVTEFKLLPLTRFRFASGIELVGTSIHDENIQTSQLAPGTSLQGTKIDGVYRGVGSISTFQWYAEPALGFNGLWLTLALRLHQQGTTDGANTRAFFGNLKRQLKFPPTFNTSYVLSDQPFFPFKDLFQSFRVRAAFGRSGRQPAPTDRLRLYGNGALQWLDGRLVTAAELSKLGNTELRPERATEIEGGLDAELLNGGLSVSFTSYRKTTDDMILAVPYPLSVYGGGTLLKNVGNAHSTGMELQVTARFQPQGPIGVATEFSLAQNRDVLTALAPGVEPFYTNYNDPARNASFGGLRLAPGYPLFGRWQSEFVGYADGNGDQVLQAEELVFSDTAVYVGPTWPNYTLTVRPTISFFRQALAVSAGFNYDDGFSQRNQLTSRFAPFSVGRNIPGASFEEQLASFGVNSEVQTVSTLRLNTLSIRYRVPQALARRVGAQNLNVFVQGTNLGLWTDYRGLDPNVNAFATGNDVADTGVLPQPRTWQVRISADY